MRMTRRQALAWGCFSCCGAAIGAPGEGDAPRPPLKELAGAKGLLIGSAISAKEITPQEGKLFIRELNVVTPETALKMAAIRPTPEIWRYAAADAIADFAATNALLMRGHTLIWNNDKQPVWLSSLSPSILRAAMQDFIERTMTRYADGIDVWDVVNEPIGDTPVGAYRLRDGPFLQSLGPEYVAFSFRAARAVAPNAKLVLNETHTERDDRFGLDYRKNLLYLIDRLLDDGVPLDGIGLQGHLQPDKDFDPDGFGAFLHEIERRKLFIDITELDVNDASFPDDIAARDEAVAATYRRFLRAALANLAVRSLTFWQLSDAASWYDASPVYGGATGGGRHPRPLLFDARMHAKPALYAVIEELKAMPARPSRT